MKMCKDCYYRKQIRFDTKLSHLLDWYCNNPDSVFYRYYVSPKHGCNVRRNEYVGDGSPKNSIFEELESIFEDEYGITDDSKTAFIFDVLDVLKYMFDER